MNRKPVPPDPPVYAIKVDGEVRIGTELDLQISLPADESEHDIVVAEHSVLPAHKRIPIRQPPQHTNLRANIGYGLAPTARSVSFKDQGLTLQYGILGGPGSGKTNTLLYLVRQIVGHCADRSDRRTFNPDKKFGGLILDPKAALIDDLKRVFRDCGREDDLIVINTRELAASGGINVIDCMLSPMDLGKALVLAAQSAGYGSSEPYWFNQMIAVFGAALAVLRFWSAQAPTLNDLLIYTVGARADIPQKETEPGPTSAPAGEAGRKPADTQWTPALEALIERAEDKLRRARRSRGDRAAGPLDDIQRRLGVLKRFVAGEGEQKKNRKILEEFMEQAYGLFRDSRYLCYSAREAPVGGNVYDQIINDGKFVLVSSGAKDIVLASILPTLVKLIFQRTLLSRFDRYRDFQLHNAERPVLFMADEYHTVATQLEGEPTGDSEFFSLARQFGGFCIVATQTVEQLQTSRLKENWKAVFGTLAAVIGMKGDDAATMEYLQKRGGDKDVLETTQGFQTETGKVTISVNTQRIREPKVPVDALKLFTSGDAVVIGTTTGHGDSASVRYVHVPYWKEPIPR